jgi:hypothetical protein
MRRRAAIERREYLRSLWPVTEIQPNLAERLRDLM